MNDQPTCDPYFEHCKYSYIIIELDYTHHAYIRMHVMYVLFVMLACTACWHTSAMDQHKSSERDPAKLLCSFV